jgi:hypothetical protein
MLWTVAKAGWKVESAIDLPEYLRVELESNQICKRGNRALLTVAGQSTATQNTGVPDLITTISNERRHYQDPSILKHLIV